MAAAKAFLVEGHSGLMVIGLDSGEGFVRRLPASEDPRGGMLIN